MRILINSNSNHIKTKTKKKKKNQRWFIWSSKCSSMAAKFSSRRFAILFFFLVFLSVVAFGSFVPPLSSLSRHHHHHSPKSVSSRKFEISDDKFWKDGRPFRIIGGDLHYFRVLPEYWDDRLLRAKALGLNAIQTYVPWNLHEQKPGTFDFDGIADLVTFLKHCQKKDLLVLLRPGPYICGEWDLGGFPPWLLSIEPSLRLRSSDPAYLELGLNVEPFKVERWWRVLLPKIAPFLYVNGGPIVMVQIENEYGSYGRDKAYLHYLFRLAKRHLGDNVILYTTDGGTKETLDKGTLRGDTVFSAVDFTTGDNPWPIFQLQKKYNAPGKSPPLSAEFYTGWLTHWKEKNAETDADFTASALEKILAMNASVVLYMAHGGTNFGFYNGANTGADESDYKPDLTSYDYDAPIRETGDVHNDKFRALRRVIEKYSGKSLPSIPLDNEKMGYGLIRLFKRMNLLDMLRSFEIVESENPLPMESVGQMFGFLLYATEYSVENDNNQRILSIPKVHDRAQVFVSCSPEHSGKRPIYVGTIERWSSQNLRLPNTNCISSIKLFILVENMGRLNYGSYIFDRKGILSSVYLDGRIMNKWNMYKIPLANLNHSPQTDSVLQIPNLGFLNKSTRKKLKEKSVNISREPAFYTGQFYIEKNKIKDTFLSLNGWGKGIAFVNGFNLGRYWPSVGPQCNLYVPAPILKPEENIVEIFELESPNTELVISFVNQPDITCGSSNLKKTHHQL